MICLVTGSSRGIGKHIADTLAARGDTVIHCSRSEGVDVLDEAQFNALLRLTVSQYGRLDALIHCVGVAAMNAALLTPTVTARRILETNVLATFTVCRDAARVMARNRFGRIVTFSSVAVPFALEGEAMYVASKAAVESLTRVLAREFAPFGITVNCVAPTPIMTDLLRHVPQAKIDALVEMQAIKRLGTVEDVWNVIEWLLRADFVTGQTIYLGGV